MPLYRGLRLLDVNKTASLKGDLDEEIYMNQLEGCVVPGVEHKLFKLIESLLWPKTSAKIMA